MSIIQNLIPFVVPTIAISMTQILIYMNLVKNLQWKTVIFGNLILLGVGVLFSIIGLIVAQGEPGSWAGLGFIILLMVTLITTVLSTFISVVMMMMLKAKQKAS